MKNNLKKLLLILICLNVNSRLFSIPKHYDDNYVSKFANRYDDDHVKYEKEEDQLIIFSEPSKILIFLAGSVSLGGLFGSIHGLTQGEWDIKLLSAGIGIASIYGLKKTIDYSVQNFSYICFDKSGCHVWDEKIFSWRDIEKIELETVNYKDSYYNGYTTHHYNYTRKYLNFYDQYKTKLLKIASNDWYLAIPLENLSALAEYYWNKYKN